MSIEYGLLCDLAVEAGRVVPYDQLLLRLRRPGQPGNMRMLRRNLGEDASSCR